MWKHLSFRKCLSLGLAVGGVAFLVYGLFFHITTISSADDAGAEVWTRAEPVLIQDVTIGQGRPTVEVAQTNVVEPEQPAAEPNQPATESGQSTVEVAKESEPSSGAKTEEPKAAPKKEAPKACPT